MEKVVVPPEATQPDGPAPSPSACSADSPKDTRSNHPPEIGAHVPKGPAAEMDKSCLPSGQAWAMSVERSREEPTSNLANSAAVTKTEVDQKSKEPTRCDIDRSDPSAEAQLTGGGQETLQTVHCRSHQLPSDLAENVDTAVQPDENRVDNNQQGEEENNDSGTVVGCSQTSMSALTSQDAEVQVAIQVQSRSIATSPMAPPDNCPVFKIPDISLRDQPAKKPTVCPPDAPSVTAPPKKDVQMQVDLSVQCKSVATGPMTPLEKTSLTTLPEVCVEAMEEEPVREVQWDEKGMTWEVYGASVDAEVLGLAIQKHLEKQIEEHGKQNIKVHQNDKLNSLKNSSRKEENKRRQSNVLQAVLHNMRSPQCCIRESTAAE
ncbi:G protein-regulated inducer of neurite outgrowth 1 [Narcine bancroftii]|uniref:G protein-regulated inducer of neurite outgrowth 1 n=1 Tax=Narcine bancroftii TaxID=1343680 RepID=UPI0038311AA7